MEDRYGSDVLAAGWRERGFAQVTEVPAAKDLVVELADSGFCGAVTRTEAGMVELEDRNGRRRSFPSAGGSSSTASRCGSWSPRNSPRDAPVRHPGHSQWPMTGRARRYPAGFS